MVTSIKFEDGQLRLDGYPDGAAICGIDGPEAKELCRLILFRGDLEKIAEWLTEAELERKTRPAICDGLFTAGLIRFCGSFKGTSGLRTRPLSRKKIFSNNDRIILERLISIRNKLVAHDEHLYPGEIPLIVLNSEAVAIEAVVIRLSSPFSALIEAEALTRLTRIALDWVKAEFELEATKIVSDFNAVPAILRRVLRDTTPEFKVNIAGAEDRF